MDNIKSDKGTKIVSARPLDGAVATFALTREWYRTASLIVWSIPAGQELIEIKYGLNSTGAHNTSLKIDPLPSASVPASGRYYAFSVPGGMSHINNGCHIFTFIYKSGKQQYGVFLNNTGRGGGHQLRTAYSLEFNSHTYGLARNRAITLENKLSVTTVNVEWRE